MSKKDDVKAKVKFFQGFIMLFVATLFAIFGYTATHYKEFDLALGIGVAIGIVLLSIAIWIFVKLFLQYTKKLRKLK
ncbi:hypothetical protein ACWIUD_01595 [Helicobacter sp. 23-1044]